MQLLMGRPLRRRTPLHGWPLRLLPVWWVGLLRAVMMRPLGLVRRVQLVVTASVDQCIVLCTITGEKVRRRRRSEQWPL